MFYKLDRNLWGVLVAAFLAAPSAQALTDDVAVQLLDRLNELEEEVSGLRGENELLRDKLQGVSSRQEELDRLRKEAEKAAAALMAPAVEVSPSPTNTESEPEMPEEADAPAALPDGDPLADIPPLESVNETTTENQPAIAEKSTEESAAEVAGSPGEPATEAAGLDTSTDLADKVSADLPVAEPVVPVPPAVASQPDAEPLAGNTAEAVVPPVTDLPATEPVPLPVADAPPIVEVAEPGVELKPAVATTATVQDSEKVDPRSTDSYYYYGTGEADPKAGASAEVAAKAEPEVQTTAPAVAAETPAEHQTKAEYNEAYQLLVSNPAAAAPAFVTFLKKYPKHELAANAQYWLAEALYAQRDYQNASQAFMTVLKQYKDSPKAPGAALKLGYSFYELSQWEYARRTLEDTVRFFPDSNAAKLAEERLQRMQAEGH